ncbi:MAG TPA: hypothetical protein VK714_00720 [Myxococcota bacterium]|nr:hypothetical protein [Myxococcota bacterium]
MFPDALGVEGFGDVVQERAEVVLEEERKLREAGVTDGSHFCERVGHVGHEITESCRS